MRKWERRECDHLSLFSKRDSLIGRWGFSMNKKGIGTAFVFCFSSV